MSLGKWCAGQLLVLSLVGCGGGARGEAAAIAPELQSYVLAQPPAAIANRTLIDFGGNAELVGYEVSPERLAAPGSKLALKLYWRSTGRFGEGFRPFTEIQTPAGTVYAVNANGPLRQGGLDPSAWQPGRVYVDEVQLEVPEELDASRFSVYVGIEHAAAAPGAKPLRVKVLSGASDGKQAGLVATLDSGVTPGTKRARSAGKGKLRPGNPMRLQGPGGAKGRPLARPLPGNPASAERPNVARPAVAAPAH